MSKGKEPTSTEHEEPLKEAFRKVIGPINVTGKTTGDQLKLFVDVLLPKEEVPETPLDSAQLYQLIVEAADPKFIHKDVIEDIAKILNGGKSVLNRRISKGVPCIPGKDGKVVYLVKKLGGKGEIKVDEKGIADYAIMHLFDNIESGQIVARVYAPKPGFPGKDVFGKDIPAPLGNPANYKLDSTLEEKSDDSHAEYKVIIAKANGYLFEENGQLSIRNELAIAGDLDYHFGIVDFIGRVKVSGDVMPGFNISAKEGIEVKGSVRGGSLVSTHGPIVVDGFVYGGTNSRVISGSSFTARIVQEVNAEIRGDIIILVEARDSQLRTESTLRMEKGLLYGGKASVVCGAECAIVGSDVQTPTQLEFVGDIETTVAFSQIKVRIQNHEKAIALIRLHLGPFAENKKLIENLKPEHKAKMRDLLSKLEKLERGRNELLSRQQKISTLSKKSTVNRVNVLSKMYPGSSIVVGEHTFTSPTELAGPVSIDFDVATGEFKVGELKGLECSYKSEELAPGGGEEAPNPTGDTDSGPPEPNNDPNSQVKDEKAEIKE